MKAFLLSLISAFLLIACASSESAIPVSILSEPKSVSFFCDFDSDSVGPNWNIKSNLEGDENKVEHFESSDLYGHTFDLVIPDSFANSTVVIKAALKFQNFSSQPSSYAFTVKEKGGKQILWEGRSLIGDSAKWTVFEDSILLPAQRAQEISIRLYPYNPKKIAFNLDSMTVELKQKQFPSFVNDIKQNINNFPEVKLNNPLFESARFVSIINGNVEPTNFKAEDDSSLIATNDYLTVNVNGFKEANGYLFGSETKFNKKCSVGRLAVIYKLKGEITEVYRHNRIASENIYGNEIWLGEEGFKLTTDSTKWICYGYNKVSSFQILKNQKLLIVNIDFEQDHPLFHFPELDTIINHKVNISANEFDENTPSLIRFFRIHKANKIKSIPRILPTQHGFQSAFLWTEHADFADFRLHKVTYYGHEKANGPSESTAGFAHHKIPVTKSVFYTVNDTLENHDYYASDINSQVTSIQKTPGFEAFLDSLHAIGNEICLHTPDFFTTDKRTMEKALSYVTKKYGSHTWIDHGYNNGHTDNREDFMCDGLNNYALELWRDYDIKYFWNGYFEDTLIQKQFKSSMSRIEPYYGFEDHLPYPISWEHNKAKYMYSWRTSTVFFPNGGGSWNYSFSHDKLNDFAVNYGVEFSHVYPAHTGHQGFWTYDADSNFIIQPEFETTLQRMADLRDRGLLQLPTVTKFMDHQQAIKLIEYSVDGDNLIIKNNGDDIEGLTLAAKKEYMSDDFYKNFKFRINGDDVIFWFDLKKGAKKVIKF